MSKSKLKLSTRRVIASAKYANALQAANRVPRTETAKKLREGRKQNPGQTRKYWASKQIGRQYNVRNHASAG